MSEKNIILIVGAVGVTTVKEFISAGLRDEYKFLCIESGKKDSKKEKTLREYFDYVEFCDFENESALVQVIKTYSDRLVAATVRGDQYVPHFVKAIPHVPYLRTPTESSLLSSVDKIAMRKKFNLYDKNLSPKHTVARNSDAETISSIESKVGYPMIVKPTGLSASLLVTICYHREELEKALNKIFKKSGVFNRVYKQFNSKEELPILIEEFIDGEMYSVDGVIGSRGKVTFYPPVHVKTGRKMGFDDFFGYQQLTPTRLSKDGIAKIEKQTKQAILALGLRSSSFHCELIKAENGDWKIVEIAPRVGGFRSELYVSSFGIYPYINDIFTRIPKKIITGKGKKGYTAALKFFAKYEGEITSIKGLKTAKTTKSVVKFVQNKTKGDKALYAKNGGGSVINIILHNENRSELLADIRRIEEALQIIVKK